MSIDVVLGLLISTLSKASEISLLIQQMQAEGRTELTPAEWQDILAKDDAARAELSAAIAAKKQP